MTTAQQPHPAAHGHDRFRGVPGAFIAVTMLIGRGALSRLVADLAETGPGDKVVDIGCGPGGAAREAARRGATVTGVDPAPVMLRIAGVIPARGGGPVTYRQGAAEAIPLPDHSATVCWAVSSVHHWPDIPAGLCEMYRILAPGGRMIIAETLTRPGARGLAAHGFTEARAEEVVTAAREAGFARTGRQEHNAGRRRLVIVLGARPEG